MILLLVLIVAALYRWNQSKQDDEHWAAEEAYLVGIDDVVKTISGDGKIVGNDLVDMSFDATAKLTEVLVKPWDIVNQGDLLARIDNSSYVNNLSRAQNALAQAQSRLAEAQNPLSGTEQSQLAKQGELDWINYQEQILKLENELSKAEQNLKTLEISQEEKETILRNAVVSNENALKSASLWFDEQVKRLELELLRLDNAVATSDRAMRQLDQDIIEAETTDDLELIWVEDDARTTQMEADIVNTSQEVNRIVVDLMQQMDLIMWITPANRYLNDSYESNIGAKDTSQKRSVEAKRRELWIAKSAASFGSTFTQAQSDQYIQVLDQARDLAQEMIRVIENSSTWNALPESQLSSRRSIFTNYQSSINQIESSLEAKILALELSKQSINRLIDTTDDTINEQVRVLKQQKQASEAAHEELLKEKELKQEEIKSTKDSFENTLANTQQETALKKSELSSSSSRTAIEYESALLDIQFLKNELIQARERHQASLELSTLDRLSRASPLSAQEQRSLALQIEDRRLAIQDAQIQLSKTELRSPVQWTVLWVANLVGEYPQANFMSIATKGARYIEVYIEEEEVGNIKSGQEVLIGLDAFPDETFSEKVYYVSSAGERDANDIVKYQVLISLDTPVAWARSEMTINAEFVEEKLSNVIAIPLEYVTKLDGKDVVYLPSDDNEEGEIREVQLWIKDEQSVHVLEGLKAGQEIVLPKEEE